MPRDRANGIDTRRRLHAVPSILWLILLMPVLLLAGASMASAQLVTNQFDAELDDYLNERIAFEAADTDGDGLVSEAELARDAAAGFSGLDRDASGTLTPEELRPHDPALFEAVDTDHDGVLTFNEVMANKVKAFQEGDVNADEGLSFDEMVTVVEQELEAVQ